jgi:hypothetical protein
MKKLLAFLASCALAMPGAFQQDCDWQIGGVHVMSIEATDVPSGASLWSQCSPVPNQIHLPV